MTKPLTVVAAAWAPLVPVVAMSWRQLSAVPWTGWLAVALSPGLGWLFWSYTRRFGAGRRAAATLMVGAPLVTLSSLVWPLPSQVVWSLFLGWSLLVLAVVDVLAFRLPDALTLPLAAAGVCKALWLREDLVGSLIGCAAGFASLSLLAVAYRRLRGADGLGLGDAKLLGAAGAWLGASVLPTVLLIACGFGFGAVLLALRGSGLRALKARLPFGGPLCAAIWLMWLAR